MDLTLRACLLCLLLTGVCGQCYGPKDPGTTGQEPGIRYFYDTAKKACFPFAYNGQGGNSNNHFSDAACRCTCLKDPAACRQVVPTRASVFQMGHLDLIVLACLFCLFPAGVCVSCIGPKDPGTGHTPVVRYYYAPKQQACFPFVYNGQGGNSNNHVSEAACKCLCLNDAAACSQVGPSQAVCRNELNRGNCALRINGWYYNATTMQCRKTIFGCRTTNGNMFPDKKRCKSVCKGVMTPDLSSFPKRCILPKKHGQHGPDAGQRFFFDTVSRTCLAFHYNGARGNKNRFDTEKDCKCTCLQTNHG